MLRKLNYVENMRDRQMNAYSQNEHSQIKYQNTAHSYVISSFRMHFSYLNAELVKNIQTSSFD